MSEPLALARWTPNLQDFRAYAALTGDANPIHIDPDYAAGHHFGQVVSHGMLIHAKLWALAEAQGLILPAGAEITFPAPAYADQPLELSFHDGGTSLRAEARRSDGTLVYHALWRRGDDANR